MTDQRRRRRGGARPQGDWCCGGCVGRPASLQVAPMHGTRRARRSTCPPCCCTRSLSMKSIGPFGQAQNCWARLPSLLFGWMGVLAGPAPHPTLVPHCSLPTSGTRGFQCCRVGGVGVCGSSCQVKSSPHTARRLQPPRAPRSSAAAAAPGRQPPLHTAPGGAHASVPGGGGVWQVLQAGGRAERPLQLHGLARRGRHHAVGVQQV